MPCDANGVTQQQLDSLMALKPDAVPCDANGVTQQQPKVSRRLKGKAYLGF